MVPPNDSELNYAAVNGARRDLWMIEGAEHGDTLRPNGPTTSARVVNFFHDALR